jgi:site-specific recombinase XerD
MTETLQQTLTAYDTRLDRQPLAAKMRTAYRLQMHLYGAYLAQHPSTVDDPLRAPFARDYVVRDYKTYLKTERRTKPTSVNLALATIDHFHQFIGNDRPQVQRENLPTQAPRALKQEEQKAFLRAPMVRNRAITQMLFYTAIRLGECAALSLDDVYVSARKGIVIIRSDKGDAYREVPLNIKVREIIRLRLKERTKRFSQASDPPVFLNPKGKRLSARTIDMAIRRIGGADAQLELSAHILRHTCLTNLVRRSNDSVLIAEIAGHKRLETTRCDSLPFVEDREKAMEGLQIEY